MISKYLVATLCGFLLFSLCTSAQKIIDASKTFTYKNPQRCVYKEKYTPEQRRKFYPFRQTDTIKLVSFRYFKKLIPIHDKTVAWDSLVEVKTLAASGVDSLTDILYNNFYRKPPPCCIGSMALCFFPRNAILFFDRTGRLEHYILICFHCGNYKKSSEQIVLGDDCSGKIEKLRQFFISSSVTFGTDMKIDQYPGEASGDVVAPPVEQ